MSQDQRTTVEAIGRTSEPRSVDNSPSQPRRRFELSLPQILAGSLAAASAAAAASWLGVAGTVLGAVVASIVVPVSTALYSHPLERSSQVIRESLPVLPERYRGAEEFTAAQPAVREAGSRVRPHTGSSGRATRRRIRWGTVAVSCLMTLIVGFAMLTALESVVGRSFASLTGSDGGSGTTVGRLVHHGNSGTGGDIRPVDPTDTGPTVGDPTTSVPTTSVPTTDPATTAPPTTTDPTTDPATTAPPADPAATTAQAPTQTGPTG